jgi:hypothetical protein
MSFGISNSVRSRAVQVCTPQLFHQATQSSVVKNTCAEIEDALESKRRGEMNQEDYDTLKTKLKAKLPILTPHATFKNGRRLNADAIPSGLSIYDKDHIADPKAWWQAKSEELKAKNPAAFDSILLVHITPSMEGLRLVFIIPEGMNLAEAQKWMSEQLDDKEYDVCVKDLARPSFIVPEDYILFINEEELFKDRTPAYPSSSAAKGPASNCNAPASGSDSNHKVQCSNLKVQNKDDVQDNQLPGTNSNRAVSSGSAVQPAQSGDSNRADDTDVCHTGDNQCADKIAAGKTSFPTEYQGIPYPVIIEKLVELLGGEPQHGSRNSFIFSLSCYLRYLCDDNAAWIKQVIPVFGEEQKRAFATVDSACGRKQSFRMPSIVRKAIQLVRNDEVKQMAGNYDDSDFGDINNPESYFFQIHQMPRKLPKLIKLLISKTPKIYKPAVSQAIFPPLATHLCETRFRYLDNVEHEATISSILCAPTGSGKEAITQPINHIMADIRKRDAEQRERERLWKDECNRKGSNKDRRERPQGLIIQEVNIDMTNPAFVLRMKEAENHFLYSKVNELNLFDALKGKTNQHFRIMELAFDLGNYGQDRVGTQSVTETVKVRFNWNACCTPKKCRDYFRRVVTDGPVSRITFCTIDRRPCGSELPVYGTYDAAFDEQLKPYIDNLVKARGAVECPEALKLAQKLLDENALFARLSQDVVFENLSFRANVIAYLKACVLYVANGMKWEKSIEDFVRWSERYDLYCKLKLFGQMIYDADREQDCLPKTAPRGPKNLLEMLPEEFSLKDYANLRREQGFDDNRKRTMDAVYQWVSRGYVVKLLKDDSADTDADSLIFRKVQYSRSYLLKRE